MIHESEGDAVRLEAYYTPQSDKFQAHVNAQG